MLENEAFVNDPISNRLYCLKRRGNTVTSTASYLRPMRCLYYDLLDD